MDNFETNIIGADNLPFQGYISAQDKTNVTALALIRGSKNVIKKDTGTWASRFGLKRASPSDTTAAGITSEYVWQNSSTRTFLMRVQDETSAGNDGKLQFMYNNVVYDLLTGLSKTRFVLDTWWNTTESRDRLVFVNGDGSIKSWSGGFTTVGYGTTLGISGIGNTTGATLQTIVSSAPNVIATTNGLGNIGGSSATQAAIVFNGQPSNGQQLTFTYSGASIFTINFVTVIGATAGNVLIGATAQDTLTNLLGLLQNPGTTSATQRAVVAPHIVELQAVTWAQSSVIVKSDTSTTWFQDGFSTGTYQKIVNIGGTLYTYTSDAKMYVLFGVTPNPTGIVSGIAIQTVDVDLSPNYNDPSFIPQFLKTINNQVWYGSYTSQVVHVSDNLISYNEFTLGTPPTLGDPLYLVFDAFVNNISVQKGHAVISAGISIWYIVSFNEITVGSVLTRQTVVDKQEVSGKSAALAHEFCDNVGDDLVFLSKDQQLNIFGNFRELNQNKYPSLSQGIRTELQEEDFTGGSLVAIGDFIHITAPIAGRDWMHQTREVLNNDGTVTAERLWHPPQIRNVSRFMSWDGVTYGYSNANPMMYQIEDTDQWYDDSPTDEPLAYDSIARFAYRNIGKRYNKLQFDKVYYEGYIAEGVTLNGKVYIDYQGSTSTQPYVINSTTIPAKYYSATATAPSLGDSSLGDNPLAAGLVPDTNSQEMLPKFRTIKKVNPVAGFEYSLEVSSSEIGSRWELLCLGANLTPWTGEAIELQTISTIK